MTKLHYLRGVAAAEFDRLTLEQVLAYLEAKGVQLHEQEQELSAVRAFKTDASRESVRERLKEVEVQIQCYHDIAFRIRRALREEEAHVSRELNRKLSTRKPSTDAGRAAD